MRLRIEAAPADSEPLEALEPVDKNVLTSRDLRQCVPSHVGVHKVVPVGADTVEGQERMIVNLTVLGGGSRGGLAGGIDPTVIVYRELGDAEGRKVGDGQVMGRKIRMVDNVYGRAISTESVDTAEHRLVERCGIGLLPGAQQPNQKYRGAGRAQALHLRDDDASSRRCVVGGVMENGHVVVPDLEDKDCYRRDFGEIAR